MRMHAFSAYIACMGKKKSSQISVRLEPEVFAVLQDIHRKHNLSPVDVARGLLEETAKFYLRFGFFNFPIRLTPETDTTRYDVIDNFAMMLNDPREEGKQHPVPPEVQRTYESMLRLYSQSQLNAEKVRKRG